MKFFFAFLLSLLLTSFAPAEASWFHGSGGSTPGQPAAVVTGVTNNPATADLSAGTVAITVSFNVPVTVTGAPTITTNIPGTTGIYSASLSTPTSLVFNYTIAAGQNTAKLTTVGGGMSLNGGSIKDSLGNDASLLGYAGVSPAGTLQIDTTSPTISSVAVTGTKINGSGAGTVIPGDDVFYTMTFSEPITLTGTPTLTLNNGGTAAFSSSTSNTIVFDYHVASGQNTSQVVVNSFNLNGGSIKDIASPGNVGVLTAGVGTFGNVTVVTPSNTVSTSFPAAETIMSQGGSWVQGCTTGLDWGCVSTQVGEAFGANQASNADFGNPVAVLAGTWSRDQTAQATVFVGTTVPSPYQEVNLRLNTTITAHSITGYDIVCSVAPGAPYLQINRWNGPLTPDGDPNPSSGFQTITSNTTTVCLNGDVLKATNVGGLISVYQQNPTNGTGSLTTPVLTGTDSFGTPFAGGSPGIEFKNNFVQPYGTPFGTNVGITNFTGTGQTGSNVTSVVASDSSGAISSGSGAVFTPDVVTLTVNFNAPETVSGTPTLTLNDGGTATYTSGSPGKALTFTYNPASAEATSSLFITAFNLPSGATITNNGTPATLPVGNYNLSGTVSVNTTLSTVSSVAGVPASGTLGVGGVDTIALNFTLPVTVVGVPTLTLNTGAIVNYTTTGSTSTSLKFPYTVANGENASPLATAITNAVTLGSGVTIKDAGGNNAVLTGANNKNIGTVIVSTPGSCVGTSYFAVKGAGGTHIGTQANPFSTIAQINAGPSGKFGANACVFMDTSAGPFTDASLTLGSTNITSGLTNANPVVFQPASGQSGWSMTAAETGGTTSAGIHAGGGIGGWTIKGLTLRPASGGTAYGLHVIGLSPGATFTNNNVYGFQTGSSGVFGDVIVDNNSGGSSTQPFVISNNTIGGQPGLPFSTGIKIGGQYTTVIGNTVSWVGGGIGMCCAATGTGNYITNNLIHDINGSPTNQCGGFGAIELDAPVANQVIARNEMYNVQVGMTFPPGCDGTGVDMDGSTGTTVVEYNFGHHNSGPSFYACIGCYSQGGNPWGPNVIRYNISENDGFRQIMNSQSSGGIGISIKPFSQGGVGCSTGCTIYVYGNTVLQNTPGGNGTSSGYSALNLSTDTADGSSNGPAPGANSVIANNIFAYTTGNFAVACNYNFTPNGTWRNNNFYNLSTGSGTVALPSSPYGCFASSTTISPSAWDSLINGAGGNASGSMGINPNWQGTVPFATPSGTINSTVSQSTSIPQTGQLTAPSGYRLNTGSGLIGTGVNPTTLGVPACSDTTKLNNIIAVPCKDFYGNTIPNGSGSGYNVGAD